MRGLQSVNQSVPPKLPPSNSEVFTCERYELHRVGKSLLSFSSVSDHEAEFDGKRTLGLPPEASVKQFRARGGISIKRMADGKVVYPPQQH